MIRAFHVSGSGRRIWLESVLVLWVIRLAMWLLPFGVVRRLFWRAKSGHPAQDDTIRRISAALRSSPKMVPGTTCLTRALAARVMLSRRGQYSELRIGVAKDDQGNLSAHAWLESRGRVVIGDRTDLGELSPLPSLDDDSP